MATTNYERVGRALELLKAGRSPRGGGAREPVRERLLRGHEPVGDRTEA